MTGLTITFSVTHGKVQYIQFLTYNLSFHPFYTPYSNSHMYTCTWLKGLTFHFYVNTHVWHLLFLLHYSLYSVVQWFTAVTCESHPHDKSVSVCSTDRLHIVHWFVFLFPPLPLASCAVWVLLWLCVFERESVRIQAKHVNPHGIHEVGQCV